ncbi:ScyD/ScyE family protein [Deinococcus pimensis]|uniref:ScyD/ScyE family protein n=1 Tax=Deinococcus pimensis TaxID=309888 RepID=UPI00048A1A83|nr:ScyD/ScyE family protein [Deinococcus pimensis]
MPSPKAVRSARSAALLLGALLLGGCAQQTSQPTPTPPAHGVAVTTNLNGPQGVLVDDAGNVWVTDPGTGGPTTVATIPGTPPLVFTVGDTARLLKVDASGTATTVATLPSLGSPFGASGASRVITVGTDVYFTSGQWSGFPGSPPARPAKMAAVLRLSGTTVTEVANLFAFEAANNPDGVPPAEGGIDSHPYDLTSLGGALYVVDAGANDLLRVDPATGTVTLVAVFPKQEVTDPQTKAKVQAQAVPTGVAVGADGALYVSLLPGEPMPPGSAKVVRVDPATGAQQDWVTGLTALTDLQRGPDGNLYAVSLGGAGPNSGAVVRITGKDRSETVLGGLNFPTSVAFNARGDAFVTVGGVAPGGKVLRYDFLTSFSAP